MCDVHVLSIWFLLALCWLYDCFMLACLWLTYDFRRVAVIYVGLCGTVCNLDIGFNWILLQFLLALCQMSTGFSVGFRRGVSMCDCLLDFNNKYRDINWLSEGRLHGAGPICVGMMLDLDVCVLAVCEMLNDICGVSCACFLD